MYDNIGSARGLLDASGTATDWYELDTFGRQVSSSGTTPNPYRFGAAWGYITDPSGMLQLGHRFYWPEVGRFVSRDPTRSASSSYAYASNRPTVGVDADGRWWWLVGIAVCLVSGCAEQAIHMSADMTDQMEALKRCAQAPNPDPANPWMAWPVPGMPEWECWHEPYVDECAYEQLHQIWVAHQEGNGWGPWQAAPRNQNGQPWGQWGD
jgi:RHS repeat-associated protein